MIATHVDDQEHAAAFDGDESAPDDAVVQPSLDSVVVDDALAAAVAPVVLQYGADESVPMTQVCEKHRSQVAVEQLPVLALDTTLLAVAPTVHSLVAIETPVSVLLVK